MDVPFKGTEAGPSAKTPLQLQLSYFCNSRPEKQLHFDSNVRGCFSCFFFFSFLKSLSSMETPNKFPLQ